MAISLWADDRAIPLHAVLGSLFPSTQAFMLIGTLFLLPIILIMYTAWSYWEPRDTDNPFEGSDDINDAAPTAVLQTVPLRRAALISK
jgi:hypothetical protein